MGSIKVVNPRVTYMTEIRSATSHAGLHLAIAAPAYMQNHCDCIKLRGTFAKSA